jgi:hypothetical protein
MCSVLVTIGILWQEFNGAAAGVLTETAANPKTNAAETSTGASDSGWKLEDNYSAFQQ